MRGVPRDRRANSTAASSSSAHAENAGGAANDLLDVAHRVEVEPMDDAKTRAQRRGQQPGARRGPDQREPLQRHLHRSGARPLTDHDVELVVLHRGIENLLDGRRQPVDLVDEEHAVLLEVRQHPGQVAGLLDDRTGGGPHRNAHLVANDVGQRGLAETRRPIQQHVIERFAPLAGGRDGHVQVVANPILADVLVEHARAQSGVELRVFLDARHATRDAVSDRSSHQFPQRRLQRLLECRIGHGLQGRVDGLLSLRPMIAEVLKRREQVAAHAIGAVGRRGVDRRAARRSAPADP